MTNPFRTLRIALAALMLVAACASTASAATGSQYDAGYKTKFLPTISGEPRLSATSCEAITNDSFAIVGQLGAGEPTESPRSLRDRSTAIMIADANGDSRLGWRRVPGLANEKFVASDFSGNSFAYVNQRTKSTRRNEFAIRKTTLSGAIPHGWGDITEALPELKRDSFISANVIILRDGGLLVVINRGDAQWIFRTTAKGRPADFGTGGAVKNAPVGSGTWDLAASTTSPLLETSDGSLILAASARPGQPAAADGTIGLLKLSPRGAVVDSFGDHGFWTPPAALAEEKPLNAGEKRLGPEALNLLGGTRPGDPLTVLFDTRVSYALGTGSKLAAVRLSGNGAQQSISKQLDFSDDGGDGGFPDARPFSFVQTASGYAYAAAWTQIGPPNTASTFGELAGLSGDLSRISARHFITGRGKFFAQDFAATPNGKYAYACGAVTHGSTKAKTSWSSYMPALRRLKL